jgi:hypothetical protein
LHKIFFRDSFSKFSERAISFPKQRKSDENSLKLLIPATKKVSRLLIKEFNFVLLNQLRKFYRKNNAKCYLPRNANFYETSISWPTYVSTSASSLRQRSGSTSGTEYTSSHSFRTSASRNFFTANKRNRPIRSFVHNDWRSCFCVRVWKTVLRIHDILVWIRIRIWTHASD